MGEGRILALDDKGPRLLSLADARAADLLVVDLSDQWAPFIFSESDEPPAGSDAGAAPAKPNAYRATFVALANDQIHPDDAAGMGPTRALDMSPEAIRQRAEADRTGKKLPPPTPRKRAEPVRNFLEPFGIPPTLSVLARRVAEDAARPCLSALDLAPLAAYAAFKEPLPYHTRDKARRDFDQAQDDAAWVAREIATRAGDAGGSTDAGLGALEADPKTRARVLRWRRGQARVAAVRALQARLSCEGLLSAKSRPLDGTFDLPTHEALAQWERKNDVFGWGFLEGETLALLQQSPADLHFQSFRRVLIERMADAAAIIEDGSVSQGAKPAMWSDTDGTSKPVPNLLSDHVDALLGALRVNDAAALRSFLQELHAAGVLPRLRVAFRAPAKPPYYQRNDRGELELEAEIDRGDVWYDFPWDGKGKPLEQPRLRYPTLTLYVKWNEQRIPLSRWRTTIGSWRSELGGDGRVYYKYKNSDVGPRIWRHIVAAPVWIPPDSTPAKDLLTKKTLDVRVGPRDVVNTDVIGPGFQSAYGLVMAIHHEQRPGGGLFDNQIRTHGSVDYTSIARRFSHGCHRLVNARAVRLFGFVLRHRAFERLGSSAIKVRRSLDVAGTLYGFELTTRGYYYQLRRPVPIEVLEGRVQGDTKRPVTAYVRKPGVDYGPSATEADPSSSDASATISPQPPPSTAEVDTSIADPSAPLAN